MKYTGRITLVLLSIFVSIIETLIGRDLEISEVFFDIIITAIAWYIGGLYDKLQFISYNDFLTRVYNRRYGDKVIRRLLAKAKLKNETLTILSLDINNFKKINDNFGHETGDRALKSLSDLLVNISGKNDLVIRWGGDEFLIVTPNLHKEAINKLIDRINQAVEVEVSKFTFNHEELKLGISIGFATFPENGQDFNKLLSIADKKMYKVKVESKLGSI